MNTSFVTLKSISLYVLKIDFIKNKFSNLFFKYFSALFRNIDFFLFLKKNSPDIINYKS